MHGPAEAAKGNMYFPAEIFRGFDSARVKFVREAVMAGRKADTVILSHINLLTVGWLIKKVNPAAKIMLIAHGIEVWEPLSKLKRKMLDSCEKIISVSSFTEDKIKALHRLPDEQCIVINNCIDPFFGGSAVQKKDAGLLQRYVFAADDMILLTLTRLTETDRYKGYNKVLNGLASLSKTHPKLKYLLAGGYSDAEKIYLDQRILELNIADRVVFAGFVKEEELPAHFALADVYVMPSMKEGFGIVFVEAMYYGIPAIAGNADGSADALLNGKLGLLVDPEDQSAITATIEKMISNTATYIPDHDLLMKHFSYQTYKEQLSVLL